MRQVEARCGRLAFEVDTVEDLEAYCASLVAPETPPSRPPGQPPLIVAPLALSQSDPKPTPRRGYVSPCAKQAKTPSSEVPPKARYKRANAGDDSPPLGPTNAITSPEKTALYAEVRPAPKLRERPSRPVLPRECRVRAQGDLLMNLAAEPGC